MDRDGLTYPLSPSFSAAHPVSQASSEPSDLRVSFLRSHPPTTPHPPQAAFSFTSPYPWPQTPTPNSLHQPVAYHNQSWMQYQSPYHTHQSILGDSPSLNSNVHSSNPSQTPSSNPSHILPATSSVNRGQSRKRNANSSGQSRNVRPRTNGPNRENHLPRTETATISGAGPIPSPAVQTARPLPDHPAYSNDGVFKSAIRKSQGPSNVSATDVWFFIAPSHNKDAQVSQIPHKIYSDLPKKSEGEWLLCKWCSDTSAHRGVWRNNTSNTTNIRAHLRAHHYDEYHDLVIKNKLKHWEDLLRENPGRCSSNLRRMDEPISLSKFSELLVRWIIVDDQSLNVVDCQELRDLLLYVGTELSENDIPHRTKLMDLIFNQFDKQFNEMKNELKHSLGRISFTSDMWSNGVLKGFMAITAHYMIQLDGHLTMKSRLITFRHVSGAHDGDNMAKHFFQVCDELGVIERIGMVTLDNALNNGTLMRSLERRLKAEGVLFSEHGNRIRCFPHVINIAVKTALSRIGDVELDDADNVTLDEIFEYLPPDESNGMSKAYRESLSKDLVGCARKLVNASRSYAHGGYSECTSRRAAFRPLGLTFVQKRDPESFTSAK